MIKFYKTLKEYAEDNNICRQTASKLFKEGKANVIEVPKGTKFIGIKLE